MNPGFNLSEAQQMLALSYVADLLGPKKNQNGNGFVITPPADDRNNPLPNDDGTTYPYPVNPIWPSGWTPAFVAPLHPKNPWYNSILQADPDNIPPILADLKFGANNVIVSYNEGMDAYVVAFAGTENLLGVGEDVLFFPVPAGPITSEYYNSTANYIVNPSYYTPSNQPQNAPPIIEPMMHFGFRMAVEEYTVKAAELANYNLIQAFKTLGKSSINLYVTGHSLGAAMAGVFSAWIQSGDFTAQTGISVNLKTYTFASPKWANDALANNFDNGITKNNMIYRVVNNLDTVPQIPPTIEWLQDLNNPSMINALLPQITLPAPIQALITTFQSIFPNGFPNFNYVHVGNTYVVQGSFPIEYQGATLPASLFPGSGNANVPATTLLQTWWQHWPFVYYNALPTT